MGSKGCQVNFQVKTSESRLRQTRHFEFYPTKLEFLSISGHFHILVCIHQAYIIVDIWTADRGTEISAEFDTVNPNQLSVSNDTNLNLSIPFLFPTTFASYASMSVSGDRNDLIFTVFLNLQRFQNVFIWCVKRGSEGLRPSDTHFTTQVFTFWNCLTFKNTVKIKSFRSTYTLLDEYEAHAVGNRNGIDRFKFVSFDTDNWFGFTVSNSAEISVPLSAVQISTIIYAWWMHTKIWKCREILGDSVFVG